MIKTDRELMQQALDALEDIRHGCEETNKTRAASQALRERLAQPEQPKMNRIASLKFSELRADGYEVCGVMIQRQNEDGTIKRGAVSDGGMVIWWHPEQPAASDPVAYWIPKAEQFALPDAKGNRPFAKVWEPLYARPQPAQSPVDQPDSLHIASIELARQQHARISELESQMQRQPLTDERIFELAYPFGSFEYGDAQGDKRLDFARAIESAHGIKGGDK